MLIDHSCFLLLTTCSCPFPLFYLAAWGSGIRRSSLPILGPQPRRIKCTAKPVSPSFPCLWGLRAVSPSLPRRDLSSRSCSGHQHSADTPRAVLASPVSGSVLSYCFPSLYISTFSCHLGYNFRRVFFFPYFIQSIATGALRGVIRISNLPRCQKWKSPASFEFSCSVRIFQKNNAAILQVQAHRH